MKNTDKILIKFYKDKTNWTPPSYSKIAEFLGFKSKNAAYKRIQKLRRAKAL